jgi:sec-independent protein translocase protein TatA
MRVSTLELVIVLVVVLLIFGPKNLPKLGRMFGRAFRKLRGDVDESEDTDES